MRQLTKKQIENILSWIGKSYPVDLKPTPGVFIEVMTKDFIILNATFDGFSYITNSVNDGGGNTFSNPSNGKLDDVIAWRHKRKS